MEENAKKPMTMVMQIRAETPRAAGVGMRFSFARHRLSPVSFLILLFVACLSYFARCEIVLEKDSVDLGIVRLGRELESRVGVTLTGGSAISSIQSNCQCSSVSLVSADSSSTRKYLQVHYKTFALGKHRGTILLRGKNERDNCVFSSTFGVVGTRLRPDLLFLDKDNAEKDGKAAEILYLDVFTTNSEKPIVENWKFESPQGLLEIAPHGYFVNKYGNITAHTFKVQIECPESSFQRAPAKEIVKIACNIDGAAFQGVCEVNLRKTETVYCKPRRIYVFPKEDGQPIEKRFSLCIRDGVPSSTLSVSSNVSALKVEELSRRRGDGESIVEYRVRGTLDSGSSSDPASLSIAVGDSSSVRKAVVPIESLAP